ncbi:hypothetical protein OnM2_022107 [Erysiphe neolycopersici]|uniref:Uncharacterized protein n=1 Tax=Erysiphe neolycopersici TaxID=212602 RepID=A0A420I2I7_9PEZI|nr:hypothetical protein OnM2_022107 [Erysiphe neolycopersici]
MEQFATQASIELPRGLEHQIFNSKDSEFSNYDLLSLLDLEKPKKKETLSPTHSVRTPRSELNTFSPLTEKRKLAHTSEQSNPGTRSSSLIQLSDKASESSSEAESSEELPEACYQKEEDHVKSSETSVISSNYLSINKDYGLGEYPFQGFLKIPDQYVCISRHQQALLDKQDSWFQSEADLYNSYARIPTKVSKNLISFFNQKINPQENIPNDPCIHKALKKYDQFHQWDYYSKRSQFIPSEYFLIPNDQKALLGEPCSWFLGESDPSNRYARIPLEVSQNLISFLTSDVKLEESSQRLEEGCINKIPELVDNSQENNPLVNSIYRRTLSLTDTQIDPDPISKLLTVEKCPKNQSRDENITLEAYSNTDREQGYEIEKDLNFVDFDQENYDKDLNAHSISFRPSKEDECGDNYSQTPEPRSRPASTHDTFSDDLRTQASENSQSPMSHHAQIENHINDNNTEDFPKETFYTNFKSKYPEYKGSLRDFTWALVYIEWLVPQDENLDWQYWDDFVRVLASEYTNNIRYCGDPITGLAYYKIKPRKALFCQNLLSPQTLQIALSSLNKNEVKYFRDAFCNGPKEPARNSYTAQSIKLNEPQEDLSQKICGESQEDFTKSSKCINESKLKECNYEVCDEKSSVSIPCEISDNYFQKAHLYSWRQFLRKRKLAGTLNTFEIDKVSRKRHCTVRQNQYSDLML